VDISRYTAPPANDMGIYAIWQVHQGSFICGLWLWLLLRCFTVKHSKSICHPCLISFGGFFGGGDSNNCQKMFCHKIIVHGYLFVSGVVSIWDEEGDEEMKKKKKQRAREIIFV